MDSSLELHSNRKKLRSLSSKPEIGSGVSGGNASLAERLRAATHLQLNNLQQGSNTTLLGSPHLSGGHAHTAREADRLRLLDTDRSRLLGHSMQSLPAPLDKLRLGRKDSSPTSARSSLGDSTSTLRSPRAAISTSHGTLPLLKPSSNSFVTIKDKTAEFHKRFPMLKDDMCLKSYVCAILLKGAFLAQGTMYVSNHNISFYSIIFKRQSTVVIPFHTVTSISMKRTAFVVPNAIEIQTHKKNYFFASFMHRDRAYNVLNQYWVSSAKEKGSAVVQMLSDTEVDDIELYTESPGPESENEDAAPPSPPEAPSSHEESDSSSPPERLTRTPPGDTKRFQHSSSADSISPTGLAAYDDEHLFPPESGQCQHCPKDSWRMRRTGQLTGTTETFFERFLATPAGLWTSLLSQEGYKAPSITPWKFKGCCCTRSLDFTSPWKMNGPVPCPKETSAHQEQYCFAARKGLVTLYSCTTYKDTPHASHYAVHIKLDIIDNDDTPGTSTVNLYTQLQCGKKPIMLIKSFLEKGYTDNACALWDRFFHRASMTLSTKNMPAGDVPVQAGEHDQPAAPLAPQAAPARLAVLSGVLPAWLQHGVPLSTVFLLLCVCATFMAFLALHIMHLRADLHGLREAVQARTRELDLLAQVCRAP